MGPVPFYDNGDVVPDGWPGGDVVNQVRVDRVYGSHDTMTEAQWRRLGEIYQGLPGWSEEPGGAAWFGPEDAPAGCLVASVEPAGLQVYGNLPIAWWQRWTAAFQAEVDAADFPRTDFGER